MKKLKQVFWYICVIACTIFADLSVHHIRDKKEQKIENQQLTLEKQELDEVLREGLYITGDSFAYTPDTVTISNMRVGENKLMIDIYFFNKLNEFGITLTKEEVLKEYENFCTGADDYDEIIVFCEDDWSQGKDYIEALREKLNSLEPYNWYDCWDEKIEEIESEQLAALCDTVWEYIDTSSCSYNILQWAQNADYGTCDLDWRLLDLADEWRCSIDEDGNYYFKFDEGKGIAYCNWGKYAHPYEEEQQLYVTKIVYDGGIDDVDDEKYDEWGYTAFAFRPVFGCLIGTQYDENRMKNSSVPEDWVIMDENGQNPCFRYGNIQVSIELDEMRIKRVIISIAEEE